MPYSRRRQAAIPRSSRVADFSIFLLVEIQPDRPERERAVFRPPRAVPFMRCWSIVNPAGPMPIPAPCCHCRQAGAPPPPPPAQVDGSSAVQHRGKDPNPQRQLEHTSFQRARLGLRDVAGPASGRCRTHAVVQIGVRWRHMGCLRIGARRIGSPRAFTSETRKSSPRRPAASGTPNCVS